MPLERPPAIVDDTMGIRQAALYAYAYARVLRRGQ